MTVAAERLGHRADEPDLAAAVGVAVARGDFAPVGGADGFERPDGVDARDEFAGGDDTLGGPVVGVADIHELDEAKGVAADAEVFAEREEFAVVYAALDDAVDFDGQSDRGGGIDAAEDAGDAEAEAVELAGGDVVEGIDGDVDAVEAGGAEGGSEFFEEPTVGREGDVGQAEVVLERADEVGHVGAQERLAAREADFFHAERSEGAGDAGEFAEGHELRIAQEGVAGAEDLLRHAVGATEITAVGHRDPEIAEGALELIDGAGHRRGENPTVRRWQRKRRNFVRPGPARRQKTAVPMLLTPAEAERLIRENIPQLHREDCPLEAAHGRILRADLRADRDLPPFDRVTMDGYALRAAALAAGIRAFRIEGVQAAGMVPRTLGPEADACVEIMTGAVLPEGADCIVPYEETARGAKVGTVTVSEAAGKFSAGHALHRRGGDHRGGEVIVRAGARLTGREIAVAAACGHAALTVAHSPKIAVVATGDELVEVEAAVAPHQIRRSNDHALRAALALAGYPRVERFHVRDIRHEIEHLLWHLLVEYDVLLLTGGVSKGKFDYLPEELARQGVKKVFHGVAQRPGKPFWFGLSARSTPVFALPGNPVSSYTCLHRYVLPALAHASGATPAAVRTVALATPVTFKPKLACLLPVKLSSGPRAELLATPDAVNTSGDFAGLVGTDGFVELPAERDEFPAGTLVPFTPWA